MTTVNTSTSTVPQTNSFCNKAVVGVATTICSSSSTLTENSKVNDAYSRRLFVESNYRDWSLLLPNYCPLKYSKPVVEFQRKIQHFVQDNSINVNFFVNK